MRETFAISLAKIVNNSESSIVHRQFFAYHSQPQIRDKQPNCDFVTL